MIVPIFSPRAFCIWAVSLLSLAESSDGFMVSNQELSYLRIDSRYLVRVFLTTRSLNINRNEYMIRDVHQIAIPTRVKMSDIVLIVAIVSSTLVVGLKESITFPIRNTNDGMPKPVMEAHSHPMYINVLSELLANWYSLEYGTIGPS